ncbi:hypothetical protein JMJ55_18190 [Belnapia sp. T6]|uniref:Uncharacterized protein n=1 Tax=Belnapia mucosa TaxID=2804532 RepID=A0ABS1V6G8_9PROT|nr:hypothetical protein [Belnapia mucosa]MBL6457269.1 hypothetical protein [Belnapia mucosa]
MNGISFSALLFGRLRPQERGPRDLRRLGWMLLAELALFLLVTLADRLPR